VVQPRISEIASHKVDKLSLDTWWALREGRRVGGSEIGSVIDWPNHFRRRNSRAARG